MKQTILNFRRGIGVYDQYATWWCPTNDVSIIHRIRISKWEITSGGWITNYPTLKDVRNDFRGRGYIIRLQDPPLGFDGGRRIDKNETYSTLMNAKTQRIKKASKPAGGIKNTTMVDTPLTTIQFRLRTCISGWVEWSSTTPPIDITWYLGISNTSTWRVVSETFQCITNSYVELINYFSQRNIVIEFEEIRDYKSNVPPADSIDSNKFSLLPRKRKLIFKN